MAHILVQVENTLLPTKYNDKLYNLSNGITYIYIITIIIIIIINLIIIIR